ncbi:hypothetical protein Tco_0722725 [Tanacetum coccineum]
MFDLMDLLRLVGPVAEAPKPMLVHGNLRKVLRPDSYLFLMPWFLVGEASTSGVPTAVATTTTTLSTTFVEAGFVPPIPYTKAPHSSIVFEKEEVDTTPEHPTVS